MPVVTAAALPASVEQRAELERMAASSSLPHRQVVLARGLLWACDGLANEEIARRCGVDSDTVRRWRHRFGEQGTAGAVRAGWADSFAPRGCKGGGEITLEDQQHGHRQHGREHRAADSRP